MNIRLYRDVIAPFVLAALLAAGAVWLGFGAARAADLPGKRPPHFTATIDQGAPWTGLHFGGFGGYSWMDSRNVAVTVSAFGVDAIVPGQSVELNSNSALLGVSAGADLQFGNLVTGALGDFQFNLADKNVSAFATASLASGLGQAQLVTSFQKIATLRGRAGFLLTPSVLMYGTAGVAFAEPGINVGVLQSAWVPIESAQFGVWRTGWTAGAGAEWRMTDNLSANIEFLHFDLGTTRAVFAAISPSGDVSQIEAKFQARFNRVTAGLNYRFAWEPALGF